ncbi:MAG TPA: hypothetical protein EYQ00_04045 [Dehalococcoidia bacterium]|nr:hypothetical protein [Dehalococcoidia bacterium]
MTRFRCSKYIITLGAAFVFLGFLDLAEGVGGGGRMLELEDGPGPLVLVNHGQEDDKCWGYLLL